MFHHLHSPAVRLLIDSPNSLPGIKRIVLFTWFIYSWWHDCLRLFVLPRYDSFSGWRSGRQKDSGCTDRCHTYIFRRIPFASLYSLSLAFMFVFSVCQDTIDDGIWCLYSRHQRCCTLPLTWQWRSISWWTLPRLWSQVGIRGIFERTCHIHRIFQCIYSCHLYGPIGYDERMWWSVPLHRGESTVHNTAQVETQRTKCWCSSSDTTVQPGPGQTPNSLLNYIPIYVTFKMCSELFSLILMMCPRETIGFWVVAFVLSYKDTWSS